MVVGAEALEVWKQAWWTLGVEDLDAMKFDGRFAREVREYVRALKSRMRVSDRREPEGKGQELNVDIGIDEVRAAIKRLLRGKAAGEDGIVNELVMYGGEMGEYAVLELVRIMWQREEIPDGWGRGVVVPFYKDGDKKDPLNYRGISLLSIVGKVYTSYHPQY